MKKILIWLFAIALTIGAAVYQRLTGPTHPLKTEIDTGRQKIDLTFPRSHAGESDCPIEMEIADITVSGFLEYRKYPGNDSLISVELKRQGDKLISALPNQPMAGKLEYKVLLERDGAQINVNDGTPIVIRFRGDVPAHVIVPHILLMFLAMLFSNVAAMYAIFKVRYQRMLLMTLVTLFIGGLILGPLVQKYAFNEYWTGVPFGWDLTDNKTLIAFVGWLAAWWLNRTAKRPVWVIVAALMTIVVFSIPHSLYGSELDHESGKIVQGVILPFFATISLRYTSILKS